MIYLIVSVDHGFCKIGYSKNPEKRLLEIQTGNPYRLSLLSVIEGDVSTERELHKRFVDLRVGGEWFLLSDEIKKFFGIERLFSNHVQVYDCFINVAINLKTGTAFKLLLWLLLNEADTTNGFRTDKDVFDRFNRYMTERYKVSRATFYNAVNELITCKAITSVAKGFYYFSPYIFWKDDKEKRLDFIKDEAKEHGINSFNPLVEENA